MITPDILWPRREQYAASFGKINSKPQNIGKGLDGLEHAVLLHAYTKDLIMSQFCQLCPSAEDASGTYNSLE